MNDFCYWYQQLIAESLGKHNKGIMPIISIVPKDNHSLFQYYLDGKKNAFYTIFFSNHLKNKKIYKGEKTADIHVRSTKNLKSINCPSRLNSSAIDEFLVIFLVAAKAKGMSIFKDLGELNKKESPRLDIAIRFLKMIGIKVLRKKDNIKIYGNPKLNLNKKYSLKNFLKDHRVFMMGCVAALTLGGIWHIHEKDSINTSFPEFIKILKKLGAKIN